MISCYINNNSLFLPPKYNLTFVVMIKMFYVLYISFHCNYISVFFTWQFGISSSFYIVKIWINIHILKSSSTFFWTDNSQKCIFHNIVHFIPSSMDQCMVCSLFISCGRRHYFWSLYFSQLAIVVVVHLKSNKVFYHTYMYNIIW